MAEQPTAERARREAGLWPVGWALAVTLAVVTLVVAAVFGAGLWLFGTPPIAKPDRLEPNQLFDLLKLAFAVAGGIGAVVALVVAYRRQRVAEAAHELAKAAQAHEEAVSALARAHQDAVAADNRHDAKERRITELYTRSVEQLGSDKAPVRLGGIYALERVAQDNPAQRQTVVNVLCAYLRMPYRVTSGAAERPADSATDSAAGAGQDTAEDEERQVRLTAQRVLGDHLRDRGEGFWPAMDLDLSSAALVDFALADATVGAVTFRGAVLHGSTTLAGTSATTADFSWATFRGPASFAAARFGGDVQFRDADFRADTDFAEAEFGGSAAFGRVTFGGRTQFQEADFGGPTGFVAATFEGNVSFSEASFRDEVGFMDAAFHGPAWFKNTTFHGLAGFATATFDNLVSFGKATFESDAGFNAVQFRALASFTDTVFHYGSGFSNAVFHGEADFGYLVREPIREPELTGAHVMEPDANHDWPENWVIAPSPVDGEPLTLVRVYPPSTPDDEG